jgi:steroid delta-isomerase-like uncharacterized protein
MSTEDNKTLNRQAIEAMSRRDVKGATEHCATDCKFHGFAPQTLDLEGYQHFLAMNFAAFPDSEFTIEDVVAERDKVATRYTNRGTHRGAMMGIPPTGRQVTVTGIVITRFVDGKAVEVWNNADDLGIMRQLGVIPSMG